MKYDSDAHHRRSIRLPDYDYAQNGVYFVTVCAHGRECLFGDVGEDGVMQLNEYGAVVETCWTAVPTHFQHIELGVYAVMPNHFHGIVVITGDVSVGARHAVPLPARIELFSRPVPGSVPTIIRSFKSAVTKEINRLRDTPGAPVWQRNYYEHIIRDERDFQAISEYVLTNASRWAVDRENPAYVKP